MDKRTNVPVNSTFPIGCVLYWDDDNTLKVDELVYGKDIECETYNTEYDELRTEAAIVANYITSLDKNHRWIRLGLTGLRNHDQDFDSHYPGVGISATETDSSITSTTMDHSINCNDCQSGQNAWNKRRNTYSHITLQGQQMRKDGTWQTRLTTTLWRAITQIEPIPDASDTSTAGYTIQTVQPESRIETVDVLQWNYSIYAQARWGTCSSGNSCTGASGSSYSGDAYYTVTYPKPFDIEDRHYTVGLTAQAWKCKYYDKDTTEASYIDGVRTTYESFTGTSGAISGDVFNFFYGSEQITINSWDISFTNSANREVTFDGIFTDTLGTTYNFVGGKFIDTNSMTLPSPVPVAYQTGAVLQTDGTNFQIYYSTGAKTFSLQPALNSMYRELNTDKIYI